MLNNNPLYSQGLYGRVRGSSDYTYGDNTSNSYGYTAPRKTLDFSMDGNIKENYHISNSLRGSANGGPTIRNPTRMDPLLDTQANIINSS